MIGCPCVEEGYVHDGVSLCEKRGMFMIECPCVGEGYVHDGCPCVEEGYVHDGVPLCGGGVCS